MSLLAATLPGEHAVEVERQPPAYVIHTHSSGGRSLGHVPLKVRGRTIASFSLSMSLRPDRSGKYLAVSQSAFILWGTDARPLARLEFEDTANRKPCCHWQFHGENPRFRELLEASRPDAKAARNLSALHFPVGGPRMRPAIEDFLQFLIQECGFDHQEGWRKAVQSSRVKWRLRQTRVIVRDAPRASAKALFEVLGVKVLRLAKLSRSVDDDVDHRFGRW